MVTRTAENTGAADIATTAAAVAGRYVYGTPGAAAGHFPWYGRATMNLADFDPDYVFSHHSATPEKLKQYSLIHESAKQFARVVLDNVPASGDRAAVIQLLREASMLACAAISLDGRLNP